MRFYWFLTVLVAQEMLKPNNYLNPNAFTFEADYKILHELILMKQEITALNDKITEQVDKINTLILCPPPYLS